jgi:hypothetical protein
MGRSPLLIVKCARGRNFKQTAVGHFTRQDMLEGTLTLEGNQNFNAILALLLPDLNR